MADYEDPKQELLKAIEVVEFVREHTHPDWNGDEQQKLACPLAHKRHETGDDSTPSLAINPVSGAFYCYGCGWKGTSILAYYTDVACDGNFRKALAILFSKYVRPLASASYIKEAHKNLLSKSTLQQRIAAMRGWSMDTIRKLHIGWDSHDKRTVIPIYNLSGLPIDLRWHDTLNRAPLVDGKRLSCKGNGQSRTGDFFPVNPRTNPFQAGECWLVEGEPDAILAYQDGLNCVTVTGGAGAWKAVDFERLKVFKDKDILICLDNDKAGQDAAQVLAERLGAVGVASLKNIIIPQGKDVSDFFLRHGGSAQQLRQYAGQTEYLIKPKKKLMQIVPLSDTGKADLIGKPIKSQILLNGKHHSPQAVPARMNLHCNTTEYCDSCPCKHTGKHEYFVQKDDPDILNWLYSRNYGDTAKEEMHLPKKCKVQADVTEWQNMEAITMIPALTTSKESDEGNYTTRQGYYLGHGIEANQTYEITAIPTVHPRTKESVLLVDKATGTHDSVTQFRLTPEEVDHLKKVFSDDPKKIVRDICHMLALNHTHIYQRWDLHCAVDLTFHSPRDFMFGGVGLPKGCLEILLFGDTRCGKGQVAEGLVRYYDLGEVVSGENASFMGLCGGAAKSGDNFQLTWGAIPLNHGRLVVIDEFSGLAADVLGRLSRVRSEGIAEINKGGINTKTNAKCRLIWIANPSKGREIASFANGVSAIMDLVGANEDVARFDLAVVVQKGEVDVHEINKLHTTRVESKYHREDLRKVVLWAWSRESDHVIFTREATAHIMQSAIQLSEMYSDSIPLIQGENARFKLAKIAAALAARCFSTEDGMFLKVTERHAELAVSLIQHFYGKPSMGYRQFSDVETGARTLTDVHELDNFIYHWPKETRRLIVDGLLSVEKFSVRELQDWCDTDAQIAKKHIGLFVRCQAIKQQTHGLYVKKPAFIIYLKAMKKKDYHVDKPQS